MADPFVIRLARRPDLGRLDALLARSYPRQLAADYPPSVLVTALPIIARARPELLASGTYFVAETPAGDLIGAGGWTPAGRAAAGEVRHVITDDRQLRRGVGRAVMAAVLDSAAGAGIAQLTCLATRTAVPFYAALGFAELGPVTVTLAPGIDFPAVRMRRML